MNTSPRCRRDYIQWKVDQGHDIGPNLVRHFAKIFQCTTGRIEADIDAAIATKASTKHSPHTWHRDQRIVTGENTRAEAVGATGTFTLDEWLALCDQHNYRCAICGKRDRMCADHIHPLSKGGSNWISNIQPLCKPCNSRKGARFSGDVFADIQLDKGHAKTLRDIMQHYGLPYGRDEANLFVMAWIDQEYAKIDEQYQQDAEREGHVL